MAAKYGNIAIDLRSRLQAGTWPVGERLPSEDTLADEYDVSRMTLRKALEALRHEGLITSVHGVGHMVARPRRPVRLPRLAGGRTTGIKAMTRDEFLADGTGRQFEPGQAQVRFEPAQPRVAEALEIDQGSEVCVRTHVLRDEGTAVQWHTAYLPRTVTRGSPLEQADLGEGGVAARLTDAGQQPLRFRETVGSRMVTDVERGYFGSSIALVLVVERVAVADHPVQLSYLVMPANRFELCYEWQAE